MGYIKINFNELKGYNSLSDTAKKVFERVYISHNSEQGINYKNDYVPISVKEHRSYLEVHFENGWLHYLPDGTWY